MKGHVASVLAQGQASAYLMTSDVNVRYVTGFTGGESEALVTAGQTYLFTDSRYQEQAASEVDTNVTQIVITKAADRWDAISEALRATNNTILGIEDESMCVKDYRTAEEKLGVSNFANISQTMLELRSSKTPEELEAIQKACQATDKVMQAMLSEFKEGVSDYDLRAELIYQIAKQGLVPSFEPIIAIGKNGAMPHSPCTGMVLRKGDLVTLDFGVKYDGYCSDMTRTIGFGAVDADLKTIYDVVEVAQKKAADAAQIGIPASRVDEVARSYIRAKGHGENFGHGTGHGVGLEIHELPLINQTSKEVISEGMVFTIEPGVYVPGLGGVRIEDTCVAGVGSMFQFPKTLIEM